MTSPIARGTQLWFASPRGLPKPAKLTGRVVVLDIAFAATVGNSISFEKTTRPLIDGLGDRLAMWIDHHDHAQHAAYAHDPRFVLATKAQHGACPEMVTPDRVRAAGPIDCIVTHIDLDGLYAAAKWLRGGHPPYPTADDDARAVDTRIGTPGPIAVRIDHAVRARARDDQLKRAVVWWLADGMPAGAHADLIRDAAAEFAARAAGTAALAAKFAVRGRVAWVDTDGLAQSFDKTDLLLAGQALAPISCVRDSGTLTIAAGFNSGWDFVQLFELGGGMPTRVSIPDQRFPDVLAKLNAAPTPVARTAAADPDDA